MSDVIVTAYPPRHAAVEASARTRAAWAVWSLAMVVATIALLVVLASLDAPVPERSLRGSTAIFAIAFAFVGMRIATRQTRNPIGWLTLAMGLAYAVVGLSEELALFALAGRTDVAIARAAMVTGRVVATLPLVPAAFVLLLFPSGRPHDRRWISAGWFVTIAGAALVLTTILIPFDESILTSPDPFLAQIRGLEMTPLYTPLIRVVTLGLILCAVPLVLRMRAARGTERQQIKWVVSAAALAVVINFLANVFVDVRGLALLQLAGILSVPAAMGIAMQRYRLYDIDTLVGRAVGYGLLTALLAAVVTAVLGFTQRAFIAVTGQSSETTLVLTTVILVTVFTPLREAIQRLIDARLKPGPTLSSFTEQVRAHALLSQTHRLVQQLAEVAARSVDATSSRVDTTAGEPEPGGLVVKVDATHHISLGARADGRPYSDRQVAMIRDAAAAVRDAIAASRAP